MTLPPGPSRGGIVVAQPLPSRARSMPLFCRHNRLTANCPICSRDMEAELRAQAPPRARPARSSSTSPAAKRSPSRARTGAGRSGGVVTRRLARAADDGYRNPLVPGLRATADAERLGAALGRRRGAPRAARLLPRRRGRARRRGGDVARVPARAGRRARAAGGGARAAPGWRDGELPDLAPERARTAAAYRAWAERAGTQAAAFSGEPAGRRSAASPAPSSGSRCPASRAPSASSC